MKDKDAIVSQRAMEIRPFLVMDVLERAVEIASGGEEIIHLEVGEPDFDTPENIMIAGFDAMKQGRTHYTPSVGVPELRKAISRNFLDLYDVKVDPDKVVVTSGSSPGIFLTLAAVLDPGCEIILSDPHYACYPNFIRFLGGAPIFVKTSASEGFQMDPDEVAARIGPKTRAIMINSPSNPTGIVMEPDRMRALASLGLPIISDEIYHGLVYEGEAHSILEYTNNAFVLNGFSKLYAMTGWRLGYLTAPADYIRPIQKMAQNFFISAADFIQWAGIEALTNSGESTRSMGETFNKRRVYMLKRLREIGFGIQVDPTAAFYILADARKYSNDSYKFAFDILEEAGVGVAPGIDFGTEAEGFLRFSYTNSLENIREGLDRIDLYLRKRFGSIAR